MYKKWRNFIVLKNYMSKNNFNNTKKVLKDKVLLFDVNLKKSQNKIDKANYNLYNISFIN